jgi:uncharacterized protein (DUF1015 family)
VSILVKSWSLLFFEVMKMTLVNRGSFIRRYFLKFSMHYWNKEKTSLVWVSKVIQAFRHISEYFGPEITSGLPQS